MRLLAVSVLTGIITFTVTTAVLLMYLGEVHAWWWRTFIFKN